MTTVSHITGKPLEPARARSSHPASSHQAAADVNVTHQQELVLRALRLMAHRGESAATTDRIRDFIIANGQMTSPSGPRSRCAVLRKAGLVRIVRHANGLAVYSLTDAGRAKALELARTARADNERKAA